MYDTICRVYYGLRWSDWEKGVIELIILIAKVQTCPFLPEIELVAEGKS